MALSLKTIAIADDEAAVRTILEALASDLQYQVVGTAASGTEALDLVRRTQPNVLLLDVHMPGSTGLDVTPQIVALKTTAIVLLTGDPNPDIARQGMDLGACGYIQKPFETSHIAAVMESAWHHFQTTTTLEEKNRQLDEALATRKLVEKAKGILMEQQGMGEEEAHRTLLKMSQDQSLAIKEVCRSIIQVRMILGKKARKTA